MLIQKEVRLKLNFCLSKHVTFKKITLITITKANRRGHMKKYLTQFGNFICIDIFSLVDMMMESN